MSGTEVSAVVASILDAFGYGMDILKRMATGKQLKRDKGTAPNLLTEKAHKSLSQRPMDIRSQYARSLASHGQQFQTGDALCQTSLARALLALNTGLIEIINTALSKNSKSKNIARLSLLDLSEAAALDTLSALNSLDSRLTIASSLALATAACSKRREKKSPKLVAKGFDKSPSSSTNIAEASPFTSRGGWVRTKSGTMMAVTPAEARKRVVERETRKRSESASAPSPRKKETSSDDAGRQHPREIAEKPHGLAQRPQRHRPPPVRHNSAPLPQLPIDLDPNRHTEPPAYSKERAPSVLIVPADFFEAHDTLAELAPPRPPKIPLHTRPNPISRPRPMSGATFMTASTKIGEIPEDRLPDRELTVEERKRRPLPYTIPPPLLYNEPKRKRRGLWPWRRTATEQSIAAY